eukprot:gene8983-6304_t
MMLQAVEKDLQEEQVLPSAPSASHSPTTPTEPKEDDPRPPSRRGSRLGGKERSRSSFSGAAGARNATRSKWKALAANSPFNFTGIGQAARFLYSVGGWRIFYSGALLDTVAVFAKFWVQLYVVIPLLRQLPPLPMTSFYFMSTFMHTLILFLPLAPLHGLVGAVNVNMVTDFVPAPAEDPAILVLDACGPANGAAEEAATSAFFQDSSSSDADAAVFRGTDESINTPVVRAGIAVAATAAPSPSPSRAMPKPSPGPRFVLRYGSWRELCRAIIHRLPARMLIKKMGALEFLGRYLASVVHNWLLARLYRSLLAPGATPATEGLTGFLLRRSLPLIVSVCVSLVTYPLVTYPFIHFMRVQHYERLRREALVQRMDEELQGYCVPPSRGPSRRNSPDPSCSTFGMGQSPPLTGFGSAWNPLQDSFAHPSSGTRTPPIHPDDAAAVIAAAVGIDDEELLREHHRARPLKSSMSLGNWWVEALFMRVCHVDVQEYLSVTIERHGFFAMYSGWAAHCLHTISYTLVGALVHAAIDRVMRKPDLLLD